MSKKAEEKDSCEFVFCVDPKTGEAIARPSNGCPQGFLERIKTAIEEKGLVLRPLKVSVGDAEA